MFTQILDPTGNLFATWIVSLIPVAVLLILLAVFRVTAWLAGWTFVLLAYLVIIGVACYFFFPGIAHA